MNPDDFLKDFPGTLAPIQFTECPDGPLGPQRKTKTLAYTPNPLPPQLDWPSIIIEHFDLHSKTISQLGKLSGLHKRVGNAAGLLRTLWMREAKLSSEIEDIDTTAEELVLAGAGRTLGVRERVREICQPNPSAHSAPVRHRVDALSV